MKRILVALFSAVLLFAACDKYDDSALQNRMNTLEGRVTELEAKVNSINADIASLQALVKALQENITVDVISKTKDGYDITFSDGVTVSISNGEKGDTPHIGVKAEDNVFYWTVDGEWLLDGEGERVIVTGAVPQVKIQDGKWFVSYDGKNWQDIGSAESMSGLVVTEDANFVYLTVPGSGTTITLSKTGRFTLDIANLDYMIQPGATTEIPYSIYGADGTEKLFVQSDDFKVTYDASKIYVTPKAGVISGEVLVMAVRNSDQAVCGVVLSFSEGILEVTPAVTIPAAGGEATVTVRTNLDYEVVIPDNAKSWLAVSPETKAVREDVVTFIVQPNESKSSRSAKVEVKAMAGASVITTIVQEGTGGASGIETVTVAEFIAKPESTDVWYMLTGKISGSINNTYGNFDLVDDTGTVYVYGLTSTKQEENDKSYASLGLKAGDIVTLIGQRGSFNGKIEVLNAYYVSHVPGQPDTPDQPTDGYTVSWPGQSAWSGIGDDVISYSSGNYTITVSKGEGSTKPTVNGSANDCRAYALNTVKVSNSSSNITSLTFYISTQGKRRLTSITPNTGKISIDTDKWIVTWTGSAKSVTLTVGEKATYGSDGAEKAGQFDFEKIIAKP